MRIYIIRHGQSESNATRTVRNNPGLSPQGASQAAAFARRIQRTPVDIIVSSDLRRALETAKIIQKHISKKLITTALLREERHPAEMEGENADGVEVARIRKQLFRYRNQPRWHLSNEENFFDLKKRMTRCARFLERRTEETILVVGHTVAARMLVGVMLFDRLLTPDLFYAMRNQFVFQNAGLTICDFINKRWHLAAWNDRAHLE